MIPIFKIQDNYIFWQCVSDMSTTFPAREVVIGKFQGHNREVNIYVVMRDQTHSLRYDLGFFEK